MSSDAESRRFATPLVISSARGGPSRSRGPRRVFVYGSLRRGGYNHGLLRGARFLGYERTPREYTMVDLGRYPGVISAGRTAVLGEVYAVSAATISRLDRLEDYPRSYDRRRIPTRFGDAWLYVYRLSSRGARRVRSGDWMRYRHRWPGA